MNPQWSPDGVNLYFLSNASGIANIYRINVSDGAVAQVTNVQTGVSGVTAGSPAFSVAATAGTLVYSAFVKGDFHIERIDSPAQRSPSHGQRTIRRLRAVPGTFQAKLQNFTKRRLIIDDQDFHRAYRLFVFRRVGPRIKREDSCFNSMPACATGNFSQESFQIEPESAHACERSRKVHV